LGSSTTTLKSRYDAGPDAGLTGEDAVPDRSAKRRVTLRDAAVRLGVSQGVIRKRAARGTIRSEMGEDGLRYVYLDDSEAMDARDGRGADGGTDALVAELRDQVRFVERQLEAERQAHAEARRIIGGPVQRIPELEATQDVSESPESRSDTPATEAREGAQKPAESWSWWQQLLIGP